MAVRADLFQSPDYFLVDDLLTEEHKLIRESVRSYVKKKLVQLLKTMLNVPNFLNKL
jgi:glutaryl-CoA dehydrogenase